MGHRRRVLDDGLHASEAYGELNELEGLHQLDASVVASPQLEGQHSAVTIRLLAGELVLRMGREARVVNPVHLRVLLEEPGYLQRGAVLLPDAGAEPTTATRPSPCSQTARSSISAARPSRWIP